MIAGFLIANLCLTAGSALASGPIQFRAAAKGPPPVPGSFELAGSNGYDINVTAVPGRKASAGFVLVAVAGKNQEVVYKAPAVVTETSMQASLGALGEISVTFQRSGTASTAECGHEKIRFDSGHYEGKIEFHGEEGYTDAAATSVAGNIDYVLAETCGEFFGGSTGGDRHARGAELHIRNPALGPEMSVLKSRPGAAARIYVDVSEYNESIAIERFVAFLLPAGDFTFDPSLRTATLRPLAPFAGTASFDRRKKAGQRWSGDLTVDMPGRSDVPLTGSALRATLVPSA